MPTSALDALKALANKSAPVRTSRPRARTDAVEVTSMELFLDNALTVGQLKKALENVPEDALVGTSIFDIVGHVQKATRVLYSKEHNILTVDSDKHVGSFSDEEFSGGPFETVAQVEDDDG
jgi:hypothetical protein